MRREEPGLDGGGAAGAPGAGAGGGLPWRPEGLLQQVAELHRGVLTSGAADQLAALVARAAHAPVGLIHFVQGGKLRLYGGYGLTGPWEDVADTPLDPSMPSSTTPDHPLGVTPPAGIGRPPVVESDRER